MSSHNFLNFIPFLAHPALGFVLLRVGSGGGRDVSSKTACAWLQLWLAALRVLPGLLASCPWALPWTTYPTPY